MVLSELLLMVDMSNVASENEFCSVLNVQETTSCFSLVMLIINDTNSSFSNKIIFNWQGNVLA